MKPARGLSARDKCLSNHAWAARPPGVEPGSQAWEACMMPLHYRRHNIGFLFCAEIPFIYTRWRFPALPCVGEKQLYDYIYICLSIHLYILFFLCLYKLKNQIIIKPIYIDVARKRFWNFLGFPWISCDYPWGSLDNSGFPVISCEFLRYSFEVLLNLNLFN